MELIRKTYSFDDMISRDLSEAPSLDIPHIKVDAFMTPKDGGKYMLFLAHVKKSYRAEFCPCCGSVAIVRGGNAEPKMLHDVMRNNYRVDILLAPPRMLCNDCGARFNIDVEGVVLNANRTERLDEFVRKEAFLRPLIQLEEITGLSDSTISNIFDEEIDKYEAYREENPLKAPRVLGIDEKHFDGVEHGTLVDVEKGLLLDILPNRNPETMIAGIKKLVGWEDIEVVTTDMNGSYLKWLPQLLPNAVIVIDQFHVIKSVGEKVKTSRKAIIERLKVKIRQEIADPQERLEKRAILDIAIRNPFLFKFNLDNMARMEDSNRLKKLNLLIDTFPEFRMLYNYRYGLEHMYKQVTREEAEKAWNEWIALLPPSGDKAYDKWCEKMNFDPLLFKEFRYYSRPASQAKAACILTYFNSPETRYTNGVTEGLNNLIGRINRDGNGYSFRHLRAKSLYASLIHERTLYGLEKQTFKKWEFRPDDEYTMKYVSNPAVSEMGSYYKYVFTEKKVEYHVPPLNVYSDNAWLTPMLNAYYVYEHERIINETLEFFDIRQSEPIRHCIYNCDEAFPDQAARLINLD